MKLFSAIVLNSVFAFSMAQAETMTCLFGVVRANDLINGEETLEKAYQAVDMKLNDGSFHGSFKVNGETVTVNMYKREYADVYNMGVSLDTPVADRPANAARVSGFSESLVNEGPAKDDGFTLKPGPNSIRYEFMKFQNGSAAFTPKLVEALKKADLWGRFPFASWVQSFESVSQLVEVTPMLLEKSLINSTDVIYVGSAFSCTKTK